MVVFIFGSQNTNNTVNVQNSTTQKSKLF